MPSTITCPEIRQKHPSETRNDCFVNMIGALAEGDTLTGTPTIAASPTGLTISNPLVTIAAVTIEGISVAAGKAVSFSAAGGDDGQLYTITITASRTSGGNAIRKVKLKVTSS